MDVVVAHLNKSTGNPDAGQNLLDTRIESGLLDLAHSADETPKEEEVECERGQLQCQAKEEDIHPNVLGVTLPVPRRRNPAAGSLGEKAEDVAADEDSAEPAWGDAK